MPLEHDESLTGQRTVVVGAGAVGFALSDFVLSGFAGAPRSEVGTFGGAGLSPSHPTAQAPTQSVRTNANGFRIVVPFVVNCPSPASSWPAL